LLQIRIRGLFDPGSGIRDGKCGSGINNLLARRNKEDVPVGVVLNDDECIAGDGDVRFQLKNKVIL
jgi:hypothetical protein